MKSPCTLPAQLKIEGDIGSRLLNVAVLRAQRLGRAQMQTVHRREGLAANPHRVDGMVALGVASMLEHFRKRLRTNPIEIEQGYCGGSIVRVFGALEYVFDWPHRHIKTRGVNGQSHLFINREGMPELLDSALAYENIDLKSPLCSPYWLLYLAFSPDGICGRATDLDVYQQALWSDSPHIVQVLDVVCRAVYRQLRADPEFQQFRSVLSYRLLELAGVDDVDLALRAGAYRRGHGLDARDVSRVWKYRPLYLRMARENPRLLPVLSAWLEHKQLPDDHGIEDAVPLMRQDLLDDGLPPRAWRYLIEHDPQSLVYRKDRALRWPVLLDVLHTLHKARWPQLPPRGFLGFLSDTAGLPQSYTERGAGVPGWFWNWACQAARDCVHDPRRYHHLRSQRVLWACLVQESAPRPDSNQQRRRLQWLQSWAEYQESLRELSDQDAWGQWLDGVSWKHVGRLRVVPLLSPRSLLDEAIAMHNCADRYLSDCSKGDYLLLSLRSPISGKRVALLGLERNYGNGDWQHAELQAPCNRPAPAWVVQLAGGILAMVRKADNAQRIAQGLLCQATTHSANATKEPGSGQNFD